MNGIHMEVGGIGKGFGFMPGCSRSEGMRSEGNEGRLPYDLGKFV